MDPTSLAATLGHRFTNQALLTAALTHRSFGASHYERLEFLGDGVLNFAIAAELYRRFPALPEGDLSRLRAHLVRQETLHRLAQKLAIGDCLRLGEGEMRSGGQQRPSILADALEAVFGAIFLDAGFDAAAGVIAKLFNPLFAELPRGNSMKDAKTRLQEWLQHHKKPLPRYVLLETVGAAHDQRFQVACEVDCLKVHTVGEGSSRRLAEQEAAEQAIKVIEA